MLDHAFARQEPAVLDLLAVSGYEQARFNEKSHRTSPPDLPAGGEGSARRPLLASPLAGRDQVDVPSWPPRSRGGIRSCVRIGTRVIGLPGLPRTPAAIAGPYE